MKATCVYDAVEPLLCGMSGGEGSGSAVWSTCFLFELFQLTVTYVCKRHIDLKSEEIYLHFLARKIFVCLLRSLRAPLYKRKS